MSIPIVIGVTGHRDIEPAAVPAIRKSVRRQLELIKKEYPHSPLVMLNSLAAGADMLCAGEALDLGIELVCPLPVYSDEYEKDFSKEELAQYRHLVKNAKRCYTAPHTEPEQPGRNYLYRQAGIYVSTRCHILMALWDGGDAVPGGCGTAEAVSFALNGDYGTRNGEVPCRPSNTEIIHINTPRTGCDISDAGKAEFIGNTEQAGRILERTEEFNSLCSRTDSTDFSAAALYEDADRLSLAFAGKYNRTLAVTALLGTLISFFFLVYDEIELHLMLLGCGILLAAGILLIRKAAKSRCHEKYVEYRALAEAARVQNNLDRAGSGIRAADLFGWTQCCEMPWIVSALGSLDAFPRTSGNESADGFWIKDQRDYHRAAGTKTAKQLDISKKALSVIYRIDIAVYLAALVYEILCFSRILPDIELLRTLTKIIIGTLSAGTLFISAYFGRQSTERVTSDHRREELFYSFMLEKYRQNGQTEELLKTLAKEELAENAVWYSYRIEDSPGLDL